MHPLVDIVEDDGKYLPAGPQPAYYHHRQIPTQRQNLEKPGNDLCECGVPYLTPEGGVSERGCLPVVVY